MAVSSTRLREILDLLEEGKITLTRGAERADMTVWEFAEVIRQEKVTWVKDEIVKEDMESA